MKAQTPGLDATTPPPAATGADRRVDLLARVLDDVLATSASGDDSGLGWLEHGATEAEAIAQAEAASLASRIGEHIGPYRLVALLGRGGMGAVFAAERSDGAFAQQVALKLLRLGVGGPRIASRFRRERAILARLEHPGIARLLDGGISNGGEPWFAMERIDGLSLIEHCSSRGLALPQRVALFLQVCDAVAYAHRSLIVHRDLKPANVMVTHEGTVKLLDFGIAKLVDHAAGDTLTAVDERVMTPDYAAPEQVLGRPVTTATDVYALGLLLFEMLTGERAQNSAGRSLLEVERCVVNLEIVRPSSRAVPHAKQLRGDLDAIVGRALRKEPERRYGSAEALAADLGRWAAGQAVEARGGAWSYRAARFVRRNRLTLSAAAAVVLALALGLAATLVQVREARSQARRAEGTRQFVVEMFRSVDPGAAENHDGVDAMRLLDGGLARLRAQPDADPADRAELLLTLADMYAALGRRDRSLELTEEAFAQQRKLWPGDDVRLLPTLAVLARRSATDGRLDQGALHADAAEALLARAGQGHDDERLLLMQTRLMIANRTGAFRAAESIAQSMLELQARRFGAGSFETGVALAAIAWTYSWQNRYDEAERAYRRALALPRGPDPHLESPGMEASPQMLRLHLGLVASYRGRHAEALEEFRAAQALVHARFGPEHGFSRGVRAHIAGALANLGRAAEAEAELRRLQETGSWAFGDWGLGKVLAARGKVGEAEPLLRAAFERAQSTSGREAKLTQIVARDLGGLLVERGAHAEARVVLEEALRVLDGIETRSSHQYAQVEARFARLLLATGDAEGAERSARHAWAAQRDFLGPAIDETALARHELGCALVALGRGAEALPHLAAAAEAYAAQYGEDDVRTAEFRFVHGEAAGDAAGRGAMARAARTIIDAPGFDRAVRARAEAWLATHDRPGGRGAVSRFDTTQWSRLMVARGDDMDARAALEALCRAYRPPVLAFVRARGETAVQAEDLTQAFFARFIETRGFAAADPERGRFRTLLLASLRHFLANSRAHAGAAKRGSGRAPDALELHEAFLSDDASPVRAFEHAWAVTLVERALARLRIEAVRAGKGALFDRLREYVLEPPGADSYALAAQELAMRSNTIAVTVNRLRQRLREALRDELVATVGSDAALRDELDDLKSVLRQFI